MNTSVRFAQPTPFRELDHTADLAIEVEGGSAEEVYARATLAVGQLLAGGGALSPEVERPLSAGGGDPVALLVDVVRVCLDRFFDERLLLHSIELELDRDRDRIAARGWFTRYDPAIHGEGQDIKAVTYGMASLVEEGGRFRASLVFDI